MCAKIEAFAISFLVSQGPHLRLCDALCAPLGLSSKNIDCKTAGVLLLHGKVKPGSLKQAVAQLDLLVLRNIIKNCHTHYLLLRGSELA